jgi:PAS domain S-box-containing protein
MANAHGLLDHQNLGWVLNSALRVALVTTDHEGLITGFSPGAERMLGYSASETIGVTTPLAFHDAEELRARADDLAAALGRPVEGFEVHSLRLEPDQAEEGEWTYVRKDGSRLKVLLSWTPLRAPTGQCCGYLGTALDITRLRDAEKALRQEKHLTDQIIDSLPGLFYLFDARLRARRWNQNTETLLGFSAQELEGKYLGDWHATAEGRDLAVQASLGVLERGGSPDAVESELCTKHGAPIPFLLTGIRVDTPEGPMLAGVGIDLTERRRLEDHLRQAQKMESVGRLAGGVAHDFNNLLTTILGNLDLATEDLPAGCEVRAYLQNIQHAANTAGMLTHQLLAFSRKEVVAPRVLDINDSVVNLKGILDRLLGENIEFRINLTPGSLPIRIDAGQLEQILLNLVINARDAMPNGGLLTLGTSNLHLDETFLSSHGGREPGDYVLLALADTGHGMNPEVLSHIFEPFYTTKSMGRGTGLGLATVFGAINQNRGLIQVQSEPGAGTIFRIYFPRSEAPREGGGRTSAAPVQGRGETILVAEDDKRIRSMVEEYLRRLGYRVVACADGREALDAELTLAGLDLLLTDLIMPDMNGKDLADRMRKRRPRVKVLFTSGYTADIIGRHGMLEAGVAFLPKPYAPADLARRVRECLDGPKA